MQLSIVWWFQVLDALWVNPFALDESTFRLTIPTMVGMLPTTVGMVLSVQERSMVRMHPEKRKAELLSLARRLFLESGFERVTIAQFLQAANLSKGGFYHHFRSKDEVLQALVMGEIGDLSEQLQGLIEQSDPVGALMGVFQYGSMFLDGDVGILSALSSEHSLHLYLDVVEQACIKYIQPALEKILQMGITEKVFWDVDISATAELVLAVNHYGNRKIVLGQWQHEQLQRYSVTALQALGRHLGVLDAMSALIEQL